MSPLETAKDYFKGRLQSNWVFFLFQFVLPGIVVFGATRLYPILIIDVDEIHWLLVISSSVSLILVLLVGFVSIGSFRSSINFKGTNEIKVIFSKPISLKRVLVITSLAIFFKPVSIPTKDALTLSYFLFQQSSESEQNEVILQSDKVVLITGMITESTYRQLTATLKKNPLIKWVILDSEGGSVFWAKKLASQISMRDLNTHVNDNCSSACVIALLAGKSRTATFYATIGLHQGYNSIWGINTTADSITSYLQSRGVSPAFVSRVNKYSSNDMMYVSREDLIKEAFVNRFTMPHLIFAKTTDNDSLDILPTGLGSEINLMFTKAIGNTGQKSVLNQVLSPSVISLDEQATIFNKLLFFALDRHAIKDPSPTAIRYLKIRTNPYTFPAMVGPLCELYKTGLVLPSVFLDEQYNSELLQILTIYLESILASKEKVALSSEEKDSFEIPCR